MNLPCNQQSASEAVPSARVRQALQASGDTAGHAAGPSVAQTAMSDSEFARLAERVKALTGIMLPLHKRQLVISRLRKRLHALGLGNFSGYLAHLGSPGAPHPLAGC